MLSETQEIPLISQKYLERFRLTSMYKNAIINTIEATRTRNQVVLISPVRLTSVNFMAANAAYDNYSQALCRSPDAGFFYGRIYLDK